MALDERIKNVTRRKILGYMGLQPKEEGIRVIEVHKQALGLSSHNPVSPLLESDSRSSLCLCVCVRVSFEIGLCFVPVCLDDALALILNTLSSSGRG